MKENIDFFPELKRYIASFLSEEPRIGEDRRRALLRIARYVEAGLEQGGPVNLTFICTHNSRRSHFGQIWAAAAAAWYGVEGVHTFSGGTEATAFNPRAVAAAERAGFRIEKPGGDNPRYRVSFADGGPESVCFSKKYDDPFNPQNNFAAVMTCSEADENCPFIPGASLRVSIPYVDPKEADDTPEETDRYDERCRQIAEEMFFVFSHVKVGGFSGN